MKNKRILLAGVLSILLTGSALAQNSYGTMAPSGDLSATGKATGKTMAASLMNAPDYSTLLKLLKASGLTKQAMSMQGQYTVFAPNNGAFDELPGRTLDELLLPSSKNRLIRFLAYHVVKGRITSDKLKDGQSLTNLTEQILVVHKQGNTITVEDGRGTVATVTQADLRATNGVVYTINKVLQKNLP